ncbi:MAG: choice-of-anchor D domain-containing protein [Verrucomicrobiaceae bacterium]|nr:choice-of-anchor D domain-containing protein [Verrucomicrobiaceae bacterium]
MKSHSFFAIVAMMILVSPFTGLSRGAQVKLPKPVVSTNRSILATQPFQYCGRIDVAQHDGIHIGSGSVAYSTYTVLTAAHVLYDFDKIPFFFDSPKRATWRLQQDTSPGAPKQPGGIELRCFWSFCDGAYSELLNTSTLASEATYSGVVAIPGTPRSPHAFAQDIAVGIAFDPLDNGNGFLSVVVNGARTPAYLSDPALQKSIIGYPEGNEDQMCQTQADDDVFFEPSNKLFPQLASSVSIASWLTGDSLATREGMSGGAVIVESAGQYLVAGVHVASNKLDIPTARFITQPVIDLLLEPAKISAQAKIVGPENVTWPVDGVERDYTFTLEDYDIQLSPDQTVRFHIEGLPNGWRFDESELTITGALQPSEKVKFTIFAYGFHPDTIPPSEDDWLPSLQNLGPAIYKTVEIKGTSTPQCGDRSEFTVRFKTRHLDDSDLDTEGKYKGHFEWLLSHASSSVVNDISWLFCSNASKFGLPQNGRTYWKVPFSPVGESGESKQSVVASYRIDGTPSPQPTVTVTIPQMAFTQTERLPGNTLRYVFEELSRNSLQLTPGANNKDTINFVYEGSDLDFVEIVGPDSLRLATTSEIQAWAGQGGALSSHPASSQYYTVLHFEDGSTVDYTGMNTPMGTIDYRITNDPFMVVQDKDTFQVTENLGLVTSSYISGKTGIPKTATLSVTYSDGERTRTAEKKIKLVPASTLNVPGGILAINPDYFQFESPGGTGTVNVTARSGYKWTSASDSSWIKITSGASGTGNGTVNFSVSANATYAVRSGRIRIGDKSVLVEQGYRWIPLTIFPENRHHPAHDSSSSFSVTAEPGQPWTAVSSSSWVTVEEGDESQTGSGTVSYYVDENPYSDPRATTITVEDATFVITQDGSPSGAAPDIVVEHPSGNSLVNGESMVSFGFVRRNQTGPPKTFIVRNDGLTMLHSLTVSLLAEGDLSDFTINSAAMKKSIAPGQSTSFEVTYAPVTDGLIKTAGLSIASNDPDEDPFIVILRGSSAPAVLETHTFQNPGINPANDLFGYSVALSGDKLVVGAPATDVSGISAGKAYAFDLSFLPFISHTSFNNPSPSSNMTGGDLFGNQVAVDGSTVLVGAPGEATGKGIAYVFNLTQANPSTPERTISAPSGVSNEHFFGRSVSLSGRRALIGAPADTSRTAVPGTAHLYNLDGVTPGTPIWSISNPSPHSQDKFGASVGLFGNLMAIGAPGDDISPNSNIGRVWVYDLNNGLGSSHENQFSGLSAESEFGASIAVGDGRVIGGGPETNDGRGDAYHLTFPVYVGTDVLPPGTASPDDNFGRSLAVDGNLLVVGASESSASTGGAAHLYLTDQSLSTPIKTLYDSGGSRTDGYGRSVAVSGEWIAVGIPWNESSGTGAGLVKVYRIEREPPAPRLVVEYPAGHQLSPSSSVDFGTTPLYSESVVEFTVKNDGQGAITDLNVTISGNDSADFQLIEPPRAFLLADGTTSFRVRFNPTDINQRQARLNVTTESGMCPSIEVNLTGLGTAPKLHVQNVNFLMLIHQSSTVRMGEALASEEASTIVLLQNTGNSPLTGLRASISGEHPEDFSITRQPPPSLGHDEPVPVTVGIRFRPKAVGYRRAELRITSNDQRFQPFVVFLEAIGKADNVKLVNLPPTSPVALPPTVVPLRSILEDDVFEQLQTFKSRLQPFEGLTHHSDAINFTNTGKCNITFTSFGKGAFTGRLVMNGLAYPLSGTFASDGTFRGSAKLKDKPTLGIDLLLHGYPLLTQRRFITGWITESGALPRTHALVLRELYSSNQTPRRMTWLMSGREANFSQSLYPVGNGCGTFTISRIAPTVLTNHQTRAKISGAGHLSDNTAFTMSAGISGDQATGDEFTFYVPLYSTSPKGSVSAFLTFRDVPDTSDLDGRAQWRKLPRLNSIYMDGLEFNCDLVASNYVKPSTSSQHALSILPSGPAETIFFAGPVGGYGRDALMPVTVGSSDKTTFNLPGAHTLTFDRINGTFRGNTNQGLPAHAKHLFKGVVVQKQGIGGGFVYLQGFYDYSNSIVLVPDTSP